MGFCNAINQVSSASNLLLVYCQSEIKSNKQLTNERTLYVE
jgi:hypothetical protein